MDGNNIVEGAILEHGLQELLETHIESFSRRVPVSRESDALRVTAHVRYLVADRAAALFHASSVHLVSLSKSVQPSAVQGIVRGFRVKSTPSG